MKRFDSHALIALTLGAIGVLILIASRALVVDMVYPAEKAKQGWTRRISSRITGMFRGAAANAENVRLKREVAALAVLRLDVERLEKENSRLRSALGYAEKKYGKWIPAGVLSFGGGAAGVTQSIRIDHGADAGIKEGAIVVVPNGLVGRVASVTRRTAEVKLITDKTVKVAVELENFAMARSRGILMGGTDERLIVKYMSGQDAEVRARVITSGVGGVFPRGIEIGHYMGNGEVDPAVNYADLEDVFVRREE